MCNPPGVSASHLSSGAGVRLAYRPIVNVPALLESNSTISSEVDMGEATNGTKSDSEASWVYQENRDDSWICIQVVEECQPGSPLMPMEWESILSPNGQWI